jgi:nucleotide-binding universal stress UspA family protein
MLIGAANAGAGDVGEVSLGEQIEELPEYSHDYLEVMAGRLRVKNVQVMTEVADGTPAHVILDVARRLDVSLIVMSTHGRSGIGRVVFGSVADAVVRNSHLPVLLVRPQPQTDSSSERAS